MEGGGRSNPQHQNTKRASKSGIVIQEPPRETTHTTIDANNLNLQPQIFKRDADQYLPITNVVRIMRRVLPPHSRIADDAKETIQECVSEFITFITSEANKKCNGEYRKTVTAEDVLSAMGTLGFENYMEPLIVFLNKHRSQDPGRSSMHHVPFVRSSASFAPPPDAQMARPPPTMGYAPALPSTYSMGGNSYVALRQMMNDHFMGNQGGGEGSSRGLEFDPNRQFK